MTITVSKKLILIVVAVLAVALALTLLASCSQKSQEPFRDAPTSGHDGSAALVVEMPDGFNNVATKCMGTTGVRVTVIYHGDSNRGSVSTVIDPRCPQ